MPDYSVRLLGPGGVTQRTVTAGDAQSVAAQLGVPPSHILSVSPAAAAAPRAGRARAFPLRLFSQELSVLLGAGIPLLEALVTLQEKETTPGVAAALGAVADGLRRGEPFSGALAARPEAFDALFVAIVSSAERTGQLREALQSHAAYLAWVDDLRGKLVNAMIYPAMLIVAGLAVLVFLLVFVVPRFAGLLEGLSGELPAASLALIELGRITGGHPWLTGAAGLALVLGPVLASRHPALRERALDALWALPYLGDKLRLLALARFYRTGSMLLGAGVPMVPALRITRAVIAPRLRVSLDGAIDAVSHGERLSVAIERHGLSTPVAVRMVRVGERSGELGGMLGKAAAFYDEELARLSEVVTRLVNPVLMLLMGGVIGTVIVLMYLPIFQLVEQVQ